MKKKKIKQLYITKGILFLCIQCRELKPKHQAGTQKVENYKLVSREVKSKLTQAKENGTLNHYA